MEHYDIVIIGGGAAGVAAAKAAKGKSVLLVEHGERLGGILLQCVHPGFPGNQTGQEYARQLLADFPETVALALETTALAVSRDKTVLLTSKERGRYSVRFSRLILATGCREIPAGALPIGGTRPGGVYTAGQMQTMMNIHGFTPEGPVAILGSGDIGLVMAWQLARMGMEVSLIEKQPNLGGMARNRKNLEGLQVAVYTGTTVCSLEGQRQLEAVELTDGTKIPSKTLLVAVGLVPEQELVHGLEDQPWLTLCGNCRCVHPMVEAVVAEGRRAGLDAAGSE